LRSDDLVFPSPKHGGYMSDSYPRNALYDALSNAGLGHLRDKAHKPRPFRFHDLRHTFGSLAVQVFPISDVKEFMGHASITTTEQYIHFVPKHDAAARLSQAFSTSTGIGQHGREVGREVAVSESS
jgi:integrase